MTENLLDIQHLSHVFRLSKYAVGGIEVYGR